MNKRRYNKGRILRSGEIQRSNGRYVYQYTDFTGKRDAMKELQEALRNREERHTRAVLLYYARSCN